MVVSQLPNIQIPAEDVLDAEDKRVLDAFKILLNGYHRSQIRLREISKAYTKLESIALSLIKEHHENDKSPQKKQTTPSPDKRARKKLSPLQLQGSGDPREDILMVDLTYDFESPEQSVNAMAGAISPVFGQQGKRDVKNDFSEETISTSENWKKIERTEEKSFAKNSMTQEEDTFEDEFEAEGNEENTPISRNSGNSESDSTFCSKEFKPIAKMGSTKTIYSIGSQITPKGKRSRQSILVFQPSTSKVDLSCSEKQTAKPNLLRRKSDIFNGNYRDAKKAADAAKNCRVTNREHHKIVDNNLVERKSEQVSFARGNDYTSEANPKLDKDSKTEKPSGERKEVSFVMETSSQINETARSLFDDDDPDDFDVSKDLLNTCMDSPTVIDKAIDPATTNDLGWREQGVGAIASTSESSRLSDSIDATYFAPGEIEMMKLGIENIEETQLGLSTAAVKTDDPQDKSRNLKRKSDDETPDETAKELGDFGVQDIDWDADISTENWLPPKRSLNNSFDIIPEKKKKSPNFAYKGKVERNKAERAKLRGWDCKECEKYYGNTDMPEDEIKKHMNRCSRHRSKYNQRYLTPKDFWNPVFPDTTDSSDFTDDESPDKR